MIYQFGEHSIEISDDEIFNFLFKKGNLRKSRPSLKEYIIEENGRKYYESDFKSGVIAYCWRLLGFYLGTTAQLKCIPCSHDLYLPYFICNRETRFDERKKLCKKCNETVDRLLNRIPKSEWRGLYAWGKAIYG